MIFPFKYRDIGRDPFDPAHRIEREVGERGRRLFIGLDLDPGFRKVCGALSVIEGKGKYLRVVGTFCLENELDKHTRKTLTQFVAQAENTLIDWRAIQEDVALAFATMADELKSQAGKYVDRLMAIATRDPGVWIRESMGPSRYFPLCDPVVLAETTGITVIDSFSVRDLIAEGTGQGLFAMPAWLLLADRNKPIAQHNRVYVKIGPRSEAFLLPASDGLDVEIPDVRHVEIDAVAILKQYFDLQDQTFETTLHELNIQGHCNSELVSHFRQCIHNQKEPSLKVQTNDSCVARSFVVALIEEIQQQLTSQSGSLDVHEIVVDATEPLLGSFVNQFQRTFAESEIQPWTSLFEQPGNSSAILVAILGAMNVDQLPGNIPWITGAKSQKILGRITPGSPSNWRQLLREMADFQPPAMRLRDAV